MTERGYSLQPIGDGAFRVSGVRVSPTTGRYVTQKELDRRALDDEHDGKAIARAEEFDPDQDLPQFWD